MAATTRPPLHSVLLTPPARLAPDPGLPTSLQRSPCRCLMPRGLKPTSMHRVTTTATAATRFRPPTTAATAATAKDNLPIIRRSLKNAAAAFSSSFSSVSSSSSSYTSLSSLLTLTSPTSVSSLSSLASPASVGVCALRCPMPSDAPLRSSSFSFASPSAPPASPVAPRIRRGSTGGVSRLVLPQQSSPWSFPRPRTVGARAVATDAGTVSDVAGDGQDIAPEDQSSPTTTTPPAPACQLAVRPAWISELASRLPARFSVGPA